MVPKPNPPKYWYFGGLVPGITSHIKVRVQFCGNHIDLQQLIRLPEFFGQPSSAAMHVNPKVPLT